MHPLVYARGLLGTKVCVVLRDSETYRGTLRMFDEHFNVVLSDVEGDDGKEIHFIRSDTLLSIAEA